MPAIHTVQYNCQYVSSYSHIQDLITQHNVRLLGQIIFNINNQQNIFDTWREVEPFLTTLGTPTIRSASFTLILCQQDGQQFNVGSFNIDNYIGTFVITQDYPSITTGSNFNLKIGNYAISREFVISNL